MVILWKIMFTGHTVPGKESDIKDGEEGHKKRCGGLQIQSFVMRLGSGG